MFGKSEYYEGDSKAHRGVFGGKRYAHPGGHVERPASVTIIAVAFILIGVLTIAVSLGSIYLFSLFSSAGEIESLSGGDSSFVLLPSGFIWLVMGVSLVFGVLELLTGFFLLHGSHLARGAALLFAFFMLFGIPIGTIFGAAIIYYLFIEPTGKAFFEQNRD